MPQLPLSGEVDSFASSHPDLPGGPATPVPLRAPKGPNPAHEAAVPEPLPSQSSAPTEAPAPVTDEGGGRAPASEDPAWLTEPEKPEATPAQTAADPAWLTEPEGGATPPPQAPTPPPLPMKQVITTNLQAAAAAKPQTPAARAAELTTPTDPVHDFVHGLEMGLQISTTGLRLRGQMPEAIAPEQADMAMRIGNLIGTFTGDLPTMMGGIAAGTVAGTLAGTAVGATGGPGGAIAGGIAGMGVGATVGAFAVPAAIRKMLMDGYDKGDLKDTGDFTARLMATAWEALKGGVTGAAVSLTGGAIAPVAGKMAGAASELVAMTTIGSALEGHLPKWQDFVDGAFVLGGMHALGHTVARFAEPPTDAKLRNIYAATGETPAQIVEQAAKDVELKQQLIAGNMQEPPQGAPKELEHTHVTEPGAEGEPAKIVGTETKLVPKEPPPLVPEKKAPEVSLSDLSDSAAAIQNTLSKLGEHGEPPTSSWTDTSKKIYVNMVDYLQKWADTEDLAKSRGANITEENSAENAARSARGWGYKADQFIFGKGTEDAKTGGLNGESFSNIMTDMEKAGLNTADFRAYSMAENAKEEFTKHKRTPWENFKPEENQLVLDALGPAYKEYNQRAIDFGNRVLDWAAEKGRYTPEQVAKWKNEHEFYSPQSRAFEAGLYDGDTATSGANIKERVGSERQILDPVKQRILNTEKIIKSTLINNARSMLIANMDAGTLIDRTGKWAETEPPLLKQVAGKEAINALNRGEAVTIFTKGEGEVFTGSKLLVDSIKRLDGDATAMDNFSKILRGFTNVLRAGVTSNPVFGAFHSTRAQIMGGVNSKTGLIPGIHPAIALAEMMRDSEGYRKFLSEGGGGVKYLEGPKDYFATDLAKLDNEKAPWLDQAWNVIKKPFQASEAMIRLNDTSIKFAEYNRSLERGASQQEALKNSRMVTPDYANIGLQRSVLRTGVAFIGAHINSLDNMYRVFERDRAGAIAKMGVISMMSASLWYLNRDDEAVNSLPDWQKNMYWNINVNRFLPGYRGSQDASIIHIPKPWAPGILFGSGVETALDAYFKPRPQELPHFAESLTKSVVPEIVPTMLQPMLDHFANRNGLTGRPLVPFYKEKLLPEMQYSPYTTETAKALGKLIGYVPFVRDLGPSSDPLASPAVIENYIHGWGGTMGGWALKTSDWAMRGGKWDSGKAEPWQDTPFIRQFVSRYPSFNDQRVQDFYENKDKADKAYNSIRAAEKQGDFAAAERLRAAHPEFQDRLTEIAKGITTARKTYENIQSDPSMASVEKRQLLDGVLFQIGSMAKEGNQMMSDFKRGRAQTNAGGGE